MKLSTLFQLCKENNVEFTVRSRTLLEKPMFGFIFRKVIDDTVYELSHNVSIYDFIAHKTDTDEFLEYVVTLKLKEFLGNLEK